MGPVHEEEWIYSRTSWTDDKKNDRVTITVLVAREKSRITTESDALSPALPNSFD